MDRIRELVNTLNTYRDSYYNRNTSLVSDFQYDMLFNELRELEERYNIHYEDSPTQSVGYKVVSELPEVAHNHLMLSLDKTQDPVEALKYFGTQPIVIMPKMDGLTCTVWYKDGKLFRAETRGDGKTGEDITHNAPHILGIPMTIPQSQETIVDGEVIITYDTFNKINAQRIVDGEEEFKHPRNLATGTVRQFNSRVCAERNPIFVAWKYVKGSQSDSFTARMQELDNLNFKVVRYYPVRDIDVPTFEQYVTRIKDEMKHCDYPIDGCVLGFDDIEYGISLGGTAHHFNDQLAFKFYDDRYETHIRDIDWTMGKTGILTPTAVFDTVIIDGTEVSRASMHNISVMKDLNPTTGCTAYVYKANQIIPQIDYCEDDGQFLFEIPDYCPICGGQVIRIKENDSEMLMCNNDYCTGKLLGKLNSFVSKTGMNIEGLSKSTILKFMELGYISDYASIYTLFQHRPNLINIEGFGITSIDKILGNIESSRKVKLEKFISAINIPNISTSTAKVIAKHFSYDWFNFKGALDSNFDFTVIDGIGDKTRSSILEWWFDNKTQVNRLAEFMIWDKLENAKTVQTSFTGKKFCITGSFEYSRDEIKKELESYGGIFVSGVSKKLDYLFVGDNAGSKLKKAQELGITIVEEEFYNSFINNIRKE